MSTPENFTVLQGNNPAETIVSMATVSNAKGYVFLFTKTGLENNEWEHKLSNRSSITLTNPEIGQTYRFKIAVLGSNGQTADTDVITKTIMVFF